MPRPKAQVPEADLNFAANLTAAREARGLSCAALAAAARGHGADISSTAVWKTENAGRRVTFGEAVALCDALGVDLRVMAQPGLTFHAGELMVKGVMNAPLVGSGDDAAFSASVPADSVHEAAESVAKADNPFRRRRR